MSTTWLYTWIWQDRASGGKPYMNLRRQGKKRKVKNGAGEAGAGLIPGRVDISLRPQVERVQARAAGGGGAGARAPEQPAAQGARVSYAGRGAASRVRAGSEARHTARAGALRGRSAPSVVRRDSETVRQGPSRAQILPLCPHARPFGIARPPPELLG